jgi:hypothetical protein
MPAIDNYDDMSIMIEAMVVAEASKAVIEINTVINTLTAGGATEGTIQAVLLADLNQGGRVFGSLTSGLKNVVKDSLGLASTTGGFKLYEKEGVKKFKWVTVGSGTCPDCLSREGREGTMDLFLNIGTPRSGWSVCRGHCRCRLVPAGYTGATNIKR